MHRYIELMREMLLAKHKYEMTKTRLQGPRVGIISKMVRDLTGLTQRQLAERLGVHHTYLSKCENGKADAGGPLLEKLYFEWERSQSMEALPLKLRLENPAIRSPKQER